MEIGLWRIDDGIQQVELGDMPSEKQLEALLERDPTILGECLLIVPEFWKPNVIASRVFRSSIRG